MPASSPCTRAFRALGLVCCTIVVLQGCGRSELDAYYFDDDVPGAGTPAAGGASNTGASSNNGGKKPGTAGTTSTTAGTSAIGGSVGQGGTVAIGGVSAGGAATAGTAQGGFAHAGTAAGGEGPVIPITCGGQICDALSETCCATLGGFGCISQDQDCSGATLVCGSSSDCGDGLVCCLQVIGEVDATSECKSACSNGPGRERRLCTGDDECSPERPFCRDTAFGVRVCTRF
jgi:hypothetical protein